MTSWLRNLGFMRLCHFLEYLPENESGKQAKDSAIFACVTFQREKRQKMMTTWSKECTTPLCMKSFTECQPVKILNLGTRYLFHFYSFFSFII